MMVLHQAKSTRPFVAQIKQVVSSGWREQNRSFFFAHRVD
jgi:hypothetical protein